VWLSAAYREAPAELRKVHETFAIFAMPEDPDGHRHQTGDDFLHSFRLDEHAQRRVV
jgi:hypothetical protein